MSKVIIDGLEIYEGTKCRFSDAFAVVTGIIKFGEWPQDGSGGEYPGTPCYGYYVQATNLEPLPWTGDTKEEVEEYYPDYLREVSLLQLLRDKDNNFEIIN